MQTYKEAMAYIKNAQSRGSIPGLERIEKLLVLMGSPEDSVRVIHVAGTNGKGSVSTFIASILTEAGYHVGRFISPAVEDYREILQIDGQWISEEDLVKCMSEVEKAVANMEWLYDISPTSFEIETAMAFYYMKMKDVDMAVIEVGMGGLLDSTNVIRTPMLSVITPIAMDHMAFLGSTIEEIAANKAGIIKEDCPVVAAGTDERALSVIKATAREKHAPLTVCDPEKISDVICDPQKGLTFTYKSYKEVHTSMAASYQAVNASLAIEAAKVLSRKRKVPLLGEKTIRKGIEKARWAGRFEILGSSPWIVVDGAHNPDGIAALTDAVRHCFDGVRIVLLMGVFKDKDHREMLKLLSEISDCLITFKPDNPRGMDASELAGEAVHLFDQIYAFKSHEDAVKKGLACTGEGDLLLHIGSLSTISDFRRILGELGYGQN